MQRYTKYFILHLFGRFICYTLHLFGSFTMLILPLFVAIDLLIFNRTDVHILTGDATVGTGYRDNRYCRGLNTPLLKNPRTLH